MIYPEINSIINIEVKVLEVKFIKDYIRVKYMELITNTVFTIKYTQNQLPGFKND